jgi:hypothetical protein
VRPSFTYSIILSPADCRSKRGRGGCRLRVVDAALGRNRDDLEAQPTESARRRTPALAAAEIGLAGKRCPSLYPPKYIVSLSRLPFPTKRCNGELGEVHMSAEIDGKALTNFQVSRDGTQFRLNLQDAEGGLASVTLPTDCLNQLVTSLNELSR